MGLGTASRRLTRLRPPLPRDPPVPESQGAKTDVHGPFSWLGKKRRSALLRAVDDHFYPLAKEQTDRKMEVSIYRPFSVSAWFHGGYSQACMDRDIQLVDHCAASYFIRAPSLIY